MSPKDRVFHIDPECYVVYVGSGTREKRPFLRIGAAEELPDAVRSVISTVIIPDAPVGNVAREPDNMGEPPDPETRYAGNRGVVDALRDAIGHKEIPTADVAADPDDEIPAAGAFVYFYRDGNVKVVRDGSPVFALDERRRMDSHLYSRVERTAQLVNSNPLAARWVADQNPSAIFFGVSAALVTAEAFAVLPQTPASIRAAGLAGIPIDRISWLATDGISDTDAAILTRLARRHRRVRICGQDSDVDERYLPVFNRIGLSAAIFREEEDSTAGLPRRLSGGQLSLKLDDEKTVRARPGDFAISLRNALVERFPGVTIVDGVRYTWSPLEMQVPSAVSRFGSDALEKWEAALQKKTAASLRHIFRHLKSGDRNAAAAVEFSVEDISTEAALLRANARSLLAAGGSLPRNRAEWVEEKLNGGLNAPLVSTAAHPVRLGAVPVYLFEPEVLATLSKVEKSAYCARRIREIWAEPAPVDFRAERVRLGELLRRLAGGMAVSTGSVTQSDSSDAGEIPAGTAPDGREVAGIDPESMPIPEDQTSHDLESWSTAPTAAERTGTQDNDALGSAGEGQQESEGRRRPWLLIAVVVVLLLGGGLLALRLLGDGPPLAADSAQDGATEAGAGMDTATDTDDEPEGAVLGSGSGLDRVIAIGEGGIGITVLDILQVTNRIAVDNGFRPIGGEEVLGLDPNWIFVGNSFTLPDGSNYEVLLGDNLWAITERFLVENVEASQQELAGLLDVAEGRPVGDVIADLRSLQSRVFARTLRERIDVLVQELQGGSQQQP